MATVFGVLAVRVDGSCRPTHYKVQLPIRPNGATGWVRAADVRLQAVHARIAVDLSERRITLFRDGRAVLATSAVIGAPSTPTPTGRFYVNQRLRASNPTGDYGPGAVGISAYSPVLLNWAQGGPIAIHGTNAPDMIGFAVSHGCLRVRNVDIRVLLRLAVEGTPVDQAVRVAAWAATKNVALPLAGLPARSPSNRSGELAQEPMTPSARASASGSGG